MSVPGAGYPPPGHDPHQQEGAGARAAAPTRPSPGTAPSMPPPTGPPSPMPPPPGGHLPPLRPGASAYRPGIVPLRPLRLGDLLDGAVRAVRTNPASMIGLAAIVNAACLIPSALVTLALVNGATPPGPGATPDVTTVLPMLVRLGFSQFAVTILTGLLVHVVSEAVLGRRPGLGETWRRARGRLLPLVGANLLVAVVTVAGMALLAGPGIALIAGGLTAVGVVVLVFGGLAGVALLVWFSTRMRVLGPAIVLEGAGVRSGWRRSFVLTGQGAFWRVLGISLLTGVIASLASGVLTLPFSLAGGGILTVAGVDSGAGTAGVVLVDHLAELLAGSVITPFTAAVTCLLYIDLRIRREALDVRLIRAAEQDAAGRR